MLDQQTVSGELVNVGGREGPEVVAGLDLRQPADVRSSRPCRTPIAYSNSAPLTRGRGAGCVSSMTSPMRKAAFFESPEEAVLGQEINDRVGDTALDGLGDRLAVGRGQYASISPARPYGLGRRRSACG